MVIRKMSYDYYKFLCKTFFEVCHINTDPESTRLEMRIKILADPVKENLRGDYIPTAYHCVKQLIMNSLEAKATSVAIRVDLPANKIQVIDNGIGILPLDFNLLGKRYATSKGLQKNKPFSYPGRGETLANIITVSKRVDITSKTLEGKFARRKIFENGRSVSRSTEINRTSKGTTVTIEGFLYNRPIRQRTLSLHMSTMFFRIKQEIEYIAIIRPGTSFSLRDDSIGEIVFKSTRQQYVYQTIEYLYGKDVSSQFQRISQSESFYSLNGLISLSTYKINKFQIIYVNRRIIKRGDIHLALIAMLSNSKLFKDVNMSGMNHVGFIISLNVPFNEIDVIDYADFAVEFQNWPVILAFIKNAVQQFLIKHKLIDQEDLSNKNNDAICNGSAISEKQASVHVSQLADGVIRGKSRKRKFVESQAERQNSNEEEKEKEVPVVPVNKTVKSLNSSTRKALHQDIGIVGPQCEYNHEINMDQTIHKSEHSERLFDAVVDSNDNAFDDKLEGKKLIAEAFFMSTVLYPDDAELDEERWHIYAVDNEDQSAEHKLQTQNPSSSSSTAVNNQDNEDAVFNAAKVLVDMKNKTAIGKQPPTKKKTMKNRVNVKKSRSPGIMLARIPEPASDIISPGQIKRRYYTRTSLNDYYNNCPQIVNNENQDVENTDFDAPI